jgi:hypothetical protein
MSAFYVWMVFLAPLSTPNGDQIYSLFAGDYLGDYISHIAEGELHIHRVRGEGSGLEIETAQIKFNHIVQKEIHPESVLNSIRRPVTTTRSRR